MAESLKSVVAVKEASGDINQMQEVLTKFQSLRFKR